MLLTKLGEEFWRDITSLGGTTLYFLVVIIFKLAGLQTTAFTLLAGYVITYSAAIVIRLIYFKQRPRKESYHNIPEKIDASSFPSVHAARIVFIALTLNDIAPSLTIFYYIIAAIVAYSRIHIKKHDWIDVIGGIVLGIITFLIVNKFF